MPRRGDVAFVATLLWVATLTGCEATDSQDLKTSGIDAEIMVSAQSADGSRVQVALMPGGDDDPFNRVELTGGDELFATAEGQRQKMSHSGAGSYVSDFAVAAAESRFVISLQRAATDDPDAFDNTGYLPAPFAIEALRQAEYSRAAELTINWSGSGESDDLTLELDGDCLSASSGQLQIENDSGSFTIPAGTLLALDGKEAESCDATLTMRRQRRGSTDRALNEESSFSLEQVRQTRFVSAP